MRLTSEWGSRRDELQQALDDASHRERLEDNSLRHFCIFSDNVLAVSVVVRSTVEVSPSVTSLREGYGLRSGGGSRRGCVNDMWLQVSGTWERCGFGGFVYCEPWGFLKSVCGMRLRKPLVEGFVLIFLPAPLKFVDLGSCWFHSKSVASTDFLAPICETAPCNSVFVKQSVTSGVLLVLLLVALKRFTRKRLVIIPTPSRS